MIKFKSISDTDPSLSHSPLVRPTEKTFAYIDEHGPIGLTPSKALKRVFVQWAAAEFDWPGYSAESYNRKLVTARMGGISWRC